MGNADAPFNGLTVDQVQLVLEQIAVSADVLVQHAVDSAQHADNPFPMHVTQHLAERIGALAELAVYSVAREDFVGWTLGERFKELAGTVGKPA